MCGLEDCNRICCTMGAADVYTPNGHVIGMLDRDQRTAVIVTYQKSLDSTGYDDRPANWTQFSYKKCKTWKTMQRLKQVLVVGTYLLSIVSIPSSLSAPTCRNMNSDRSNSHPKWINPCGIKEDSYGDKAYLQEPQLAAKDILATIITAANVALTQATNFKETFAEKTLPNNFDTYQESWEKKDYDWLPTKHYSKKEKYRTPFSADFEQLNSLNLNDSLISIYEHFQKIAVGLEQIVWDQQQDCKSCEKGPVLEDFTHMENRLVALLCEIQMAIIELGLTPKADIERSHMPDVLRCMDITNRTIRDFIIYRDYLITLEYAIQIFSHLKSSL